ncbi:MAG: MarR family transcriptional regulator [Pseudacidovorax sp.]|nr:MarR family transcriptional regulator [Pseudacidovorax sp.]
MSPEPRLVESTIPALGQPRTIFDLLNFRISEFYNVAGSLVTRMCEGEFGITREEWAFLAIMAALGPVSPSDLARQSTADRSQTSKAIRHLVERGLIQRETVPTDRRRAVVQMTARGMAMYRKVFPRVVHIHRELLCTLDADEQAVLARCIQKVQVRALEVERDGLVDATTDRRKGGSRRTQIRSAAWQAQADTLEAGLAPPRPGFGRR